jgi:hypothetical protein
MVGGSAGSEWNERSCYFADFFQAVSGIAHAFSRAMLLDDAAMALGEWPKAPWISCRIPTLSRGGTKGVAHA